MPSATATRAPSALNKPVNNNAFVFDSYFNSFEPDEPEAPVAKHRIQVPTSWGASGQGVKAWRREWRAAIPGDITEKNFWNPGRRVLRTNASRPRDPNFFAANQNTVAIVCWDCRGASATPPASTITSAYLAITVRDGNDVYVEPNSVIPYYYWGAIESSSKASHVPAASDDCATIFGEDDIVIAPGGAQSGGTHQTGPSTAQRMNEGCLATLQFADTILQPPNGGVWKVQLAIFLELTSSVGTPLWVFDDPEMEVDVP